MAAMLLAQSGPAFAASSIDNRADAAPANCASCHQAQETATGTVSLAGLCAEYIEEQLIELESGRRRPRSSDTAAASIHTAHRIDAEAARTAAEYYSRLIYTSSLRVIEVRDTPSTALRQSRETESLIILRREDTKAQQPEAWIDRVPPGSLRRGHQLALGMDRRAPRCANCHGKQLQGLGPVPPLAGRSPNYLADQLWAIKAGLRAGPVVTPMRAVVSGLRAEDLIDLSAYLANLKP